MTLRDEVWDAVIETLVEEGKFQIGDLNFEESERHTVRRVLRNMEDQGYLRRDSPQAKTWRAGERAKDYLALTDRARVLADE